MEVSEKGFVSSKKGKEIRLQYSGHTIGDTGRPISIPRGSTEENIIVNWMEDGLRFRNTTIVINEYRTDIGKEHVGRSAIMNAFMRMRPLINKVKKDARGSYLLGMAKSKV